MKNKFPSKKNPKNCWLNSAFPYLIPLDPDPRSQQNADPDSDPYHWLYSNLEAPRVKYYPLNPPRHFYLPVNVISFMYQDLKKNNNGHKNVSAKCRAEMKTPSLPPTHEVLLFAFKPFWKPSTLKFRNYPT